MARAPHRAKPQGRTSPPPSAPLRVAASRTGRVDLEEDPHAHIVCRVCGRIQRVELTELDRHLLTELAAHHPDDWSVDGIAFSLTGACQRCREGPAARR